MATILVVDDSPTAVAIVAHHLGQHGHCIIAADDGQAALEQAVEHQPDLILLDVILPKMNGYQVCRRMRATEATAHIPIIMLTSKSLDTDRQRALEQGADTYLMKPYAPDDLIRMIEILLTERARHEPGK